MFRLLLILAFTLACLFGVAGFASSTVHDNVVRQIELPKDNTPLYSLGNEYRKVSYEDVLCLAENIYFEARNQIVEGMIAVAKVTINRVLHADYPDSVCGVVHEPWQFSWTMMDTSRTPKMMNMNKIDKDAWVMCKLISIGILTKNILVDDMYGVTHYHANYVSPDWSLRHAHVFTIQDHLFYVSL